MRVAAIEGAKEGTQQNILKMRVTFKERVTEKASFLVFHFPVLPQNE